MLPVLFSSFPLLLIDFLSLIRDREKKDDRLDWLGNDAQELGTYHIINIRNLIIRVLTSSSSP